MHWAERRLSLLVLFLGLGFLSSSVSVAAQDLPLETYTSDETDLSFQYPAGWLIQEVGVNDIYIGNSADAMNQIASPATPFAPDTVLVQLSVDIGPVTPGVVWRPIDVLGAMTGTLAEQIPDATIGEPETVTVAGNEAARLKVTSSGAQVELLFYVVQTGETLTLVTDPNTHLNGNLDAHLEANGYAAPNPKHRVAPGAGGGGAHIFQPRQRAAL